MGRNGKGRFGRFLSYIHPGFLTPTHAVVIVGIVSLLAVKFTLEFASSMINFGALIAFTVALFGLEALVRWRVGGEEMPATEIISLADRNVFIYFEETLQHRVERVFWESLAPFGNLVIGPREGLTGDGMRLFKPQDRRLGIYLKSQYQHARP